MNIMPKEFLLLSDCQRNVVVAVFSGEESFFDNLIADADFCGIIAVESAEGNGISVPGAEVFMGVPFFVDQIVQCVP